MILFGVRSPLVVDYEETCHRLGRIISAAVSVQGEPRLVDRAALVALADFNPAATADPFIACAFAPGRRAELIALATRLGLSATPALIDPSAVLARTVRVGVGSFINAGVVIGAVSLIGEGVVVNRSASLGHHTVLGDHVSVGPGATLAGNIQVGNAAMIGAGAVVLPHLRIGAGAVVAAGAVVRHHVPDGALVAGHPARHRAVPRRSSLHTPDAE
jgi:sugar O-acyltransferase (sialic acid O-acetyltransferase NeuD family)